MCSERWKVVDHSEIKIDELGRGTFSQKEQDYDVLRGGKQCTTAQGGMQGDGTRRERLGFCGYGSDQKASKCHE
jgi:hypothetical protein